jgi:DNA-directed RNA polymerase specialized sigma subunit
LTTEELFSLQRDNNELRSLYIELAKHEDFNPYKSNIITDMPKGSEGKNFTEWYAEERDRIQTEIELCKKRIHENRKKIEAYINKSPYPERDIIRYRVINNLSWEEIGGLIGYSRFQVSRKFWRYIKRCS